jgi:hypothetical protein
MKLEESCKLSIVSDFGKLNLSGHNQMDNKYRAWAFDDIRRRRATT